MEEYKIYILNPEDTIPHTKDLFRNITSDDVLVVYVRKYIRGWMSFLNPTIARKLYYLYSGAKQALAIRRRITKSKRKTVAVFGGIAANILFSLVFRICLPSNVKRCIYFVDPISRLRLNNRIEFLKRIGYNIYTFDLNDSKNYGIHFMGQFSRFPNAEDGYENESDFFFCGKLYKRKNEIKVMYSLLTKCGYKCNFIIPTTSRMYVSTKRYYSYLNACRCVVDITQPNQDGITRRPLEAMMFNKKLITNNKRVMECDFYDEHNIMVVNDCSELTFDKLKCFLESPPIDISYDIKKKYDVNSWIKLFTKD